MGGAIPQKERTLTMGAAIIYCSGHWLRGISDLVSLVRRCAPWYLALGCNFHSLVSVGGPVGRWTTTPAWHPNLNDGSGHYPNDGCGHYLWLFFSGGRAAPQTPLLSYLGGVAPPDLPA